MALWLCRLRSEECPDVSLARSLGLGAWVLGVDLLDDAFHQDHVMDRGLPLVLEWHLRAPLAVDAESRAAKRFSQWLRAVDFLRWQGRPLLLINGTHWFSHPRHAGLRLKAVFESAVQEPILILNHVAEVTDHLDGVFEAVNLHPQTKASAERANYEVFLRDAHWRKAPKALTIPAVRALTLADQDRYVNASSDHYRQWLRLLSRWSELQCEGSLDAPVLIDSWAGHRLWWTQCETPQPFVPWLNDLPTQLRSWGTPSADNVAVLVHGYYLDALDQMLDALPRDKLDLYVSTPLRQLPAATCLLHQQKWPRVHLFGVPNRGRDMAPFLLELLPAAQAVGHSSFIKLHTKSSPHLSDGDNWSSYLLKSLLNQDLIQRLQCSTPNGLLAAAGTLVPISLQLHNNAHHLACLQRRFGLSGRDLLDSRFIAGSMFAGRLSALTPLLQLGLERCDFEPESGQTDGTLAHALERWIGVVATSIEELPGNARAVPGFGFYWSKNPDSL